MCFAMSRASPRVRNLARRLIDYEARATGSSEAATAGAFAVCEKLRPQLVVLSGNGGFRALLSRAVVLASAEVPWLRALVVNREGALTGLEEIESQLSADALLVGRVALLAQMLGLLVAFIGEELTLRLAREVWPQTPLDDLELVHEEKNAKEK
jgi:hypothetical protein